MSRSANPDVNIVKSILTPEQYNVAFSQALVAAGGAPGWNGEQTRFADKHFKKGTPPARAAELFLDFIS